MFALSSTRILTCLSVLTPLLSFGSAQGACGEGETLFTHAFGDTCVPEGVERVVALEWKYAENLLALGLQPAGVADIKGYKDWVRLPVELDDTVIDVGTRQEPSLERLAELRPDLIITAANRVGETYEQLSAIAPTLVFNPYVDGEEGSQYEEMRSTFAAMARAVGREVEGTAVLEELDRKLSTTTEALEQAGKRGTPFVLASLSSADDGLAELRMFTDNALATQVITALGLKNAWQSGFEIYGFETVGIEGLQGLRDIAFFYVLNDEDDVLESDTVAPLWASLEFVRSGQAYPIGGDTWLYGGPLSVVLLIDKVASGLLGPTE